MHIVLRMHTHVLCQKVKLGDSQWQAAIGGWCLTWREIGKGREGEEKYMYTTKLHSPVHQASCTGTLQSLA